MIIFSWKLFQYRILKRENLSKNGVLLPNSVSSCGVCSGFFKVCLSFFCYMCGGSEVVVYNL